MVGEADRVRRDREGAPMTRWLRAGQCRAEEDDRAATGLAVVRAILIGRSQWRRRRRLDQRKGRFGSDQLVVLLAVFAAIRIWPPGGRDEDTVATTESGQIRQSTQRHDAPNAESGVG